MPQDSQSLRQLGIRRSGTDRFWLLLVPSLQGIGILLAPMGVVLIVFQFFPNLQYGTPGFLISVPAFAFAIGLTVWSVPKITYRNMRNQAVRWRSQHSLQAGLDFVGLSIGNDFASDGVEISVDYGLLEVRQERLCFEGTQAQFALPLGQIRGVEVRSIKAFGMPQPRLFLKWGTDDREEWISFDFREVRSAREQAAKAEEFAAQLREVIRPSPSLAVQDDEVLPIRASGLRKPVELTNQEFRRAFVLGALVWIPVFSLLCVVLILLHIPKSFLGVFSLPTFIICWSAILGRTIRKKGQLRSEAPQSDPKNHNP